MIFITGPSRAKLGRTAQQQLLTLASLDSEIPFWFLVTLHALLNSCTCMWYMNDNHLGVDFFLPRDFLSQKLFEGRWAIKMGDGRRRKIHHQLNSLFESFQKFCGITAVLIASIFSLPLFFLKKWETYSLALLISLGMLYCLIFYDSKQK